VRDRNVGRRDLAICSPRCVQTLQIYGVPIADGYTSKMNTSIGAGLSQAEIEQLAERLSAIRLRCRWRAWRGWPQEPLSKEESDELLQSMIVGTGRAYREFAELRREFADGMVDEDLETEELEDDDYYPETYVRPEPKIRRQREEV
jgi:hypothetical protein